MILTKQTSQKLYTKFKARVQKESGLAGRQGIPLLIRRHRCTWTSGIFRFVLSRSEKEYSLL